MFKVTIVSHYLKKLTVSATCPLCFRHNLVFSKLKSHKIGLTSWHLPVQTLPEQRSRIYQVSILSQNTKFISFSAYDSIFWRDSIYLVITGKTFYAAKMKRSHSIVQTNSVQKGQCSRIQCARNSQFGNYLCRNSNLGINQDA